MSKILKIPSYIFASFFLLYTVIYKNLFGFHKVFLMLEKLENKGTNTVLDQRKFKNNVRIVNKLCRFINIESCLIKSIATFFLLHRFGIKSTLHIGVKLQEVSDFHSHAWVSSCGKVALEDIEYINSFKIIKIFQI